MGNIYAQLIKERTDATLVAMVGNSPEKTEDLARSLSCVGIANGDVEELIRLFPDIDAYVVATPEWLRGSVMDSLWPTGKPILVEKPVATSAAEIAHLETLCREQVERVSVVHSLRYSPRFSQAIKLIVGGKVGDIRHIYARRNPSVESVRRVLGRFPLSFWLSCHDVDIMRCFTNSEVRWVEAITRGKLMSEDDYLSVRLRFENGVDAVEEISWCSPPLSAKASTCFMSVKGTKGYLEIDDSDMNVTSYRSGNKVESPDTYEFFEINGNHYGVYFHVIDSWIKSLLGRTPFLVTWNDGLAAAKVCEAINRAVGSGKREDVGK